MGARPSFVPAVDSSYVPFSVNVFLPTDTSLDNLYYLTGILNSRLIWKWLLHHAKFRGKGLEINGHVLAKVPVPKVDFARLNDRRQALQISKLVEQTLSLHEQLDSSVNTNQMATLTEQIKGFDERIDQLVYELYDLNDQDIRLIERSTH